MAEDKPTFMQQAFTSKGLFWLVLLVGLIADIATKALADKHIRPTDPEVTVIIPGFFGWKWAENEGAAFSILHGQPVLLALIASVVLAAVFVYVYKAEPKRRWFLLALAMVSAGAIGNLYDRMLLGHVRDFIYFDFDLPFYGFGIGSFRIPQRWPVWNVADMEIMAGVGILLVLSFKKQPKSSLASNGGASAEQSSESDSASTEAEKPELLEAKNAS
jgi:signal peptidase II